MTAGGLAPAGCGGSRSAARRPPRRRPRVTTGIAGLTLGGGIGYLDRLAGLSCDNLLGAEIVTADGQVLEVNSDTHPEL